MGNKVNLKVHQQQLLHYAVSADNVLFLVTALFSKATITDSEGCAMMPLDPQ